MHSASDDLELIRKYRPAFGSFDPAQYAPFLAPEPTYHAGMTMRRGRAAYHTNTGCGKVLYPFGALRTTERRAIAEGDWVALLTEREAIKSAMADLYRQGMTDHANRDRTGEEPGGPGGRSSGEWSSLVAVMMTQLGSPIHHKRALEMSAHSVRRRSSLSRSAAGTVGTDR